MTLVIAQLPDDPARLAGWLEQRLLGTDLPRLVAELDAVHGAPAAPPEPVAARLGPLADAVLAGGLAVLPPGLVRELLRQPRWLLELQDLVLRQGGAYWDRVEQAGVDEAVRRGAERLRAALERSTAATTTAATTTAAGHAVPWFLRPWAVCLATAAAVLIAAGVWFATPEPAAPPVAAWGWAAPEALPRTLPAPDYLNALADGAAQWFKKRPETAEALRHRVAEFRQGCDTLLAAPHEPLAEPDRAWLRERCRAWAGKLDEQVAALDAGADVAAVRDAVDGTAARMAQVLREKAAQVRAG